MVAARDSGPQVFVEQAPNYWERGHSALLGGWMMREKGTEVTCGGQTLHGSYSILVISLCSSPSLHESVLCLLCPGKSYTCPPIYHSGLWLHLVFYSHDKALAPSLLSGSLSPLQRGLHLSPASTVQAGKHPNHIHQPLNGKDQAEDYFCTTL